MKRTNRYLLCACVASGSLFGGGYADAHPEKGSDEYLLKTTKEITPYEIDQVGKAWIVDKNNFPAIDGVTCYTLELWDKSMRLPHWHPNSSELGYVVSGTMEIIIWRSPGETSIFTLGQGSCWFIPKGALHSLNNIGGAEARILVGFSSSIPQDIDLPVAFNGLPDSIRMAYTSPHAELKKWEGVINNPLVGRFSSDKVLDQGVTGSPYKFDFADVAPLFEQADMGSVAWGVKDNWDILKDISVLRAHLKPGIARDAIWYPDAGTLYIVSQGKGQFHVIVAGQNPKPLEVSLYDYVFVPPGTLHTFINNSDEDFEVIGLFTQANPLPEVSLSVATSFFPKSLLKDAMTRYGKANQKGDPLKGLKFSSVSPYLLKLPKATAAPNVPAKALVPATSKEKKDTYTIYQK